MKKSQAFSVDVTIAIIGFVAILIFLIWGSNESISSIRSFDQTEDLYTIAFFTSESLLLSLGDPHDWHIADTVRLDQVESIGLSSGSSLSEEKIFGLIALNDSSYNNISDILGVSGPNYNLFIQFYFDNGTSLYTNDNLSFGVRTANSSAVVFSRVFILDNSSNTTGRMDITISGGII